MTNKHVISQRHNGDTLNVKRFAILPRMIQGKWVWMTYYRCDHVYVHGREEGCSEDIYQDVNLRLY